MASDTVAAITGGDRLNIERTCDIANRPIPTSKDENTMPTGPKFAYISVQNTVGALPTIPLEMLPGDMNWTTSFVNG